VRVPGSSLLCVVARLGRPRSEQEIGAGQSTEARSGLVDEAGMRAVEEAIDVTFC
jgi:hypothetical protein